MLQRDEIQTVLLDQRNVLEMLGTIIREVAGADFVGLDIETQDRERHAGLTKFCNYNEETGEKKGKKLVFDMKRTVVTGFSIYVPWSTTAWYVNLAHIDVENRIPFAIALHILNAKRPEAKWICHNAQFEITALGESLGFEFPDDVICTMQMAVSLYGPDEYSIDAFKHADLGPIGSLIPDMRRLSLTYDSSVDREFKGDLGELVSKITAKESKAAHSYNGWVKSIAWGYGLKQAVERHFGYQMATFQDTLDGEIDMGMLTGEQVADYGADDAYWAVRLFYHFLGMFPHHAPNALTAFFDQENPMVHVYADVWRQGMKIDIEKIEHHRREERKIFAGLLRELKAALRETNGFDEEPDPRLVKWETRWYAKNPQKYREKIWDWVMSDDCEDDFKQCAQVRSPVSNAWVEDLGGEPSKTAVNLVYYMQQRTLFYDLLKLPLIIAKGKVQSDAECRGKLKDRAQKALAEQQDDDTMVTGWRERADVAIKVLDLLTAMSGVEQRMKLYLTPYVQLFDREHGRVFPVLSCDKASRRMGMTDPNGMQLAKRGESTYIRGTWVADHDDHVVFSRDWSAIELVIIGEESGDEEFAKVFGQAPHGDLHSGAAADILGVTVPGLDEEIFKAMKKFDGDAGGFAEEFGLSHEHTPRLFTNLKGELMSSSKAVKYWRTEIGKGANFNFWYSGWLGTVGEKMGWNMETTAEAVGRYTNRFWQAEAWRRNLIMEGAAAGFIELPDGHRRYRYEATDEWKEWFLYKFPLDDQEPWNVGLNGVVNEIARRIQKRAHNQLVNTKVQGTCAALAKRAILKFRAMMKELGWTHREARFMMPIHDELVFSVHKDLVWDFCRLSEAFMNNHPGLIKNLCVDSSPAVGLTFEPWSTKSPLGQVELYEAPAEIVGESRTDTRLDKQGVEDVVRYLFDKRDFERKAA